MMNLDITDGWFWVWLVVGSFTIPAALFLVYGLVRVASLAWHKSKFDSLRSIWHGIDKEDR